MQHSGYKSLCFFCLKKPNKAFEVIKNVFSLKLDWKNKWTPFIGKKERKQKNEKNNFFNILKFYDKHWTSF